MFTGEFSDKNTKSEAEYYKTHFENKLINEIKTIYERKVQIDWLKQTTPEYTNLALKALEEEENRADKYYPESKRLVIA